MTDSVPEKLGKYKIIEEVGRGGFAAVYKALDTTLDRTVALKVLAPHLLWDPTFVQRFQREAKVAANLDHAHIVTIYEVSQIEGVYFIAMQFLEGRTLSQILEAEGPWPVPRVQAIMEQITSALDYAHARGFVHRDVKPSNVIVADDGRATLTDFGLVKAGEGTQLTASGVVFGTPEYMSPEQAEGKALDARSDVYSLGVVLFEMLAGQVPFVADTTPAVMYKHVHELPPLDELPPGLPQGVVAVVEKALAKKREERYQSVGEMAAALQRAVSEAVAEEAKAPLTVAAPPPETPSPEAERALAPARLALSWKWGAGVGAAVVVVVGLIFALTRGCKPLPPPPSTETEVAPLPKTDTPTTVPTKTPTPVPPTIMPVVPTPTFTPLPPTPTFIPLPPTPSAPSGMVPVPAGPFKMGSDDAEVDDIAVPLCKEHFRDNCTRGWFIGGAEQPQHEVYLDAFCIDETEVTNADFARFVEETGYQTEAEKAGEAGWRAYAEGKDKYPVVKVTWNDADAYCQWAGKRLPTEAEWEKAARGPEGLVFPWGDEFDGTKLNYCDTNCEFDWADRVDDGYADTAPVGHYPAGASWCDALDMAGNVWEWTADLFKAYPDSRFQSKDPDRDSKCRVLRGGSWGEAPHFARGSNRKWELPEHQEDNAGFRCAMDAE